jgi:FkbM family methyltransferase
MRAGGNASSCSFLDTIRAIRRRLTYNPISRELITSSALLKTDRDGYKLLRVRGHQFWEPPGTGSVAVAQIAELESKYAYLTPPVKPGDIVLDCGANVGVFTRMALDSGAAKVVAIEPAPHNVECLRRTFAGEIASGRVVLCEKGVWDKEDFLTLAINNETEAKDSFVRTANTRSGPKIALTTIDNLVATLKLPRVDFIKMDIEGAEKQALTGARGIIRAYHPRMEISVDHLPEDPVQVPLLLGRLGVQYRQRCLVCALGKDHLDPTILLLE